MDARWAVVVPVKELHLAKTRLHGLATAERAELALAMATDVVAAALACPVVDGVVVVTNDVRAARELGTAARVVADSADSGIDAALVDGARYARGWWPRCGVAAVASDLPCLRPGELAAVLETAAAAERCVVPDARGDGTAVLTARAGVDLAPQFGPGSRARHAAAGAALLSATGFPAVRRDVDTIADLDAAVALGVGPATAAALRALGRGGAEPR